MDLHEVSSVPQAALPLEAFRAHLRLGTGFVDSGAEDAALLAYLRAAVSVIEGRTAKVLLTRQYRLVIRHWASGQSHPVPVAPVQAVSALSLTDGAGAETVIVPSRYRLVRDGARPRLEGSAGGLPVIAWGGYATLSFSAGFGASWAEIPPDLAQAVMLLAAQYYELRHDGAGEVAAMPFGVMALIERWRTIRVLGGRGGEAGL